MSISDYLDIAAAPLFAGLAGLLLGAFFFGSLWWSVRRTLSSRNSALWHVVTSLVRMAVPVLGFLVVGGGRWERIIACLAGFLVARLIATRLTRLWVLRQMDQAGRNSDRTIPEIDNATQY